MRSVRAVSTDVLPQCYQIHPPSPRGLGSPKRALVGDRNPALDPRIKLFKALPKFSGTDRRRIHSRSESVHAPPRTLILRRVLLGSPFHTATQLQRVPSTSPEAAKCGLNCVARP